MNCVAIFSAIYIVRARSVQICVAVWENPSEQSLQLNSGKQPLFRLKYLVLVQAGMYFDISALRHSNVFLFTFESRVGFLQTITLGKDPVQQKKNKKKQLAS